MFGLMRKRKHEKQMALKDAAIINRDQAIRSYQGIRDTLIAEREKLRQDLKSTGGSQAALRKKLNARIKWSKREIKNRDNALAERDDRINALMKDNYKLREDRRKLNSDLERIKANMPKEVYRSMFAVREPEGVRIAHYGPSAGRGKRTT